MLGTPPAFILSQDRTLTFKCLPDVSIRPVRLTRTKAWLCSVRFYLLLGLFCSLNILFGIFRVALLFYCQSALSWLVSRNSDRISCLAFSVKNFFKLFFRSLFCVDAEAFRSVTHPRANINIPFTPMCVNYFFKIFLNFIKNS